MHRNSNGALETTVTEANRGEIERLAAMGRAWLREQARRATANAMHDPRNMGYLMGLRLADFRAAWRLAAAQ